MVVSRCELIGLLTKVSMSICMFVVMWVTKVSTIVRRYEFYRSCFDWIIVVGKGNC
jgi:hypothetical protein